MANPRRRAVCTRAWVVAVLAWSLVRAVVVGRTLGRYGVSPWAYGALDLLVSWPYAMATAGVVTNLLDGELAAARRCGLVGAAAFLAPDLYLMLAGHGKPKVVYCAVATVAVAFAVGAVASIAVQVRNGKRQPVAGPALPSPPEASAPVG
jgi:hypothetical protein